MHQSSVTIRQATEADAARLHELHTKSVRGLCSGHYTAEVIHGWLVNRSLHGYLPAIKRGEIFVAEHDSTVVGFGEAAEGTIRAVYVDPTSAKRGVGKALLHHALEIAGPRHVVVIRLEATLNAVGFYERFGFHARKQINVHRGSVAVPCILMERNRT